MEPVPHGKRQGRIDPSPKKKDQPLTWDLEKAALYSRVDLLEGRVESLLTVVNTLNTYREINDTSVNVLVIKLKETIRAVERLAKGKSIGCLGLPTEESWDPPV